MMGSSQIDGLIEFFKDPVKNLQALKTATEAARAAAEDHRQVFSQARAAVEELKSQRAEMEKREASVSNQAAMNAKDRDGLRMRSDALDRRAADLEAEMQAKRATLDGLLSEAQAKRTQLDVAAAAIAERERAAARLEDELAQRKDQLAASVRDAENQLAELKQRAERAKALFL